MRQSQKDSPVEVTPGYKIIYIIVNMLYFLFALKLVGMAGFEPTTSASRTLRASQTALHPVVYILSQQAL